MPLIHSWPFVLLSLSGPCSSRGRSYTSKQCLRYPEQCKKWSRLPGHPNPGVQSQACQRWRIHWPSKMAWQQCAPERTPPPWQCRLSPPVGVSVGISVPQRTTWRKKMIQNVRRKYKTKGHRRGLFTSRTDSPLVHKRCGQLWNETEVGKVGKHTTCLKSPHTYTDKPRFYDREIIKCVWPLFNFSHPGIWRQVHSPGHNHMHRAPPSGGRQKSCPP